MSKSPRYYAQASPAEFEGILTELAADKNSDAVLFIFVPPSMVDVKEVENGLRRVAPLYRSNKKTLLVCFMGHKGFPPRSARRVNTCPVTPSPKARYLP